MNRYCIKTIETIENNYWINAETEQQAKEFLATNCYDPECYFLDEKIQSVVLEAEGVEVDE